MGRYPVGTTLVFLRPILTWVIPVGVMTTIPAEALAGDVPVWLLGAAVAFAVSAFALASLSFRRRAWGGMRACRLTRDWWI